MVFSSHKGDVTSCASRLWRAAWELCVLAFQGLSLTRLWFQMFFLYTRYLGKWSNVTCNQLRPVEFWRFSIHEKRSFRHFMGTAWRKTPSWWSHGLFGGFEELFAGERYLIYVRFRPVKWGGKLPIGASFWEGLFHWKNFGHYISHTIHLWCIHLYLVHFYGKCR